MKRPQTRQRSRFAVDLMRRVWDSHNSTWVREAGRTIWAQEKSAEKARDKHIARGRNPDHLKVEKVYVSIKLED